jgi:hypothetical protein
MGQWAVSGVQAMSAAPAPMTTRPSHILLQILSNTSPRHSNGRVLHRKKGIGRVGAISCRGPQALGGRCSGSQ